MGKLRKMGQWTGHDIIQMGRHELKYLFFDCLGSLLYAIGIYSFAAQANFAPGGITGVSIILNHIWKFLPIGTMALLLNIPIILLSYRFLGAKFLLRTAQTLAVSAVFIDFILPAVWRYDAMASSVGPLLAALFAGGFSGLGLAIIYNAGTCTGGTDLVIMSARKVKPHLSIGQITLFTDGAIILAGAFFFKNVDAVLYGILYTIVSTVIIDKLMYGFSSGKMTLIICHSPKQAAAAIMATIDRGITYLKGEGAYTGTNKDILMCACSKKQLPDLKRVVSSIDPNALIIVMEYNEARGKGFKRHDSTT